MYLLSVLLVFLTSTAALAAPPSSESTLLEQPLLEHVQSRYQSIRTFSGGFHQWSYGKDGSIMRQAQGTVLYQRPGKMRWMYHKPEEQLLVTDGTTLWLYDPLLENVTIQSLKNMTTGTALSFLLGVGNLRTDFTQRPLSKSVLKIADDGSQGLLLELKPKKMVANIEFIQMEVHPKSYDLQALVLVDTQGNSRVIRFLDMSYNTPLEKDDFVFRILPGMEVIQNEE